MGTMRTLKLGMVCVEVETLQKLLGLAIDGKFGQNTLAALKKYQASRGLAADGICGTKTWARLKADYKKKQLPEKKQDPITPEEKTNFIKPIHYLQWDKKWTNVIYSLYPNGIYVDKNGNKTKQTIGTSGCGPTSAAIVVATLKNPDITPVEMAKAFVKLNYRTPNDGTKYTAFKWVHDYFDFAYFQQTKSESLIKKILRNKGLVICNMGPGYWTKGGHYVVAWSYDDTYIYITDPNSKEKTKQKWSEFNKELKQAFGFIG